MFEEFKKIKIIDKIITICENQVELQHGNIDAKDRYVKITGTCFLVKNYESCYNELVGIIFRELKLGRTFSSDYVREFIDSLISETLKIGVGRVKEDKLIIDIFDDHFQEVIVYIPLDGIELEVEKLKVGKITLRKMNLKIVSKIADKLEILLRNSPYYNPKDIEKSLAFQRELILRFKDKICGEFILFGEEDIAIRTGFEECSRSLDLLKYSSFFFYPSDHNVNVGFEGEFKRYYNEILAHSTNFNQFKLNSKLQGPIQDFAISEDKIAFMEKIGIFKASEILKKPIFSDFEETILLGIHWFANSLSQKEIENQFLSLMIILEVFLTPGGTEPVTKSISESIARILLAGLNNRKVLKDGVKKLYKKRSAIVHGRKKDTPSAEDVSQLRAIASDLILWMIEKSDRFENKDEVLDYIEDRSLA